MIEFVKLFFTDIRVFAGVMLVGAPIGLLVWAFWKDAKDEGLL